MLFIVPGTGAWLLLYIDPARGEVYTAGKFLDGNLQLVIKKKCLFAETIFECTYEVNRVFNKRRRLFERE